MIDNVDSASPLVITAGSQDCYTENGAPVKCWKCGGTKQREEVRSMVDVLYGQGPVCEYEVFCAECGTAIGYWAYGSFDPSYMQECAMQAVAQQEPRHGD
jgi:hypothetical protein